MKKHKSTIIISLMFLLLLLIIMSESSQKKINWYPSFSVKHKIPYGSYIAYQEARKIFKDELKSVQVSPYVFLSDNPTISGTYLLYNTSVQPGKTNLKALLEWVNKGNDMMISASDIDKELLDTLHLEIRTYFKQDLKKTFRFGLYNQQFRQDTAVFDKLLLMNYFVLKNDTETRPVVLGSILSKDADSLYNFIKADFGKGHIYLHTLPYVFSNYFILKDQNVHYFEGILSYLNLHKPVLWDIRIQNGATTKGLFKYILQSPSLLWSYRLLFLGLLLYLIFEGKRKQRAIPVITPLRNETLEFTKTIADMYMVNKENKAIAMLHIKHFLDYVRTQLHLDTRRLDNDLAKKIAGKTKTETGQIIRLFQMINDIQQSEKVKKEMVFELEKLIEIIKKK
jgi:hypothetical protein